MSQILIQQYLNELQDLRRVAGTTRESVVREDSRTCFADHKEKVIDLLMRMTRVSVETVAIVEAMRQLPRT